MTKDAGTGSFADMFESAPKQLAFRRCKVGDVLDLEVVRITEETVLVALDGKHEGVIDARELSGPDGKSTVRVGSRVAARVVEIERGTGLVRLSPVSAAPIVAALSEAGGKSAPGASVVPGMRVMGKVTGVERYGLFVEFQLPGDSRKQRGLIPTSELGAPRGADLRKGYPPGTEIESAVVSVDERGRIRLSVVALAAAEERKAFESYAASGEGEGGPAEAPAQEKARGGKGKGGGPAERMKGFGTLGDLMKKRK